MTTKSNLTRNIDTEKITAERLTVMQFSLDVIALVGAYSTTGKIIPEFV